MNSCSARCHEATGEDRCAHGGENVTNTPEAGPGTPPPLSNRRLTQMAGCSEHPQPPRRQYCTAGRMAPSTVNRCIALGGGQATPVADHTLEPDHIGRCAWIAQWPGRRHSGGEGATGRRGPAARYPRQLGSEEGGLVIQSVGCPSTSYLLHSPHAPDTRCAWWNVVLPEQVWVSPLSAVAWLPHPPTPRLHSHLAPGCPAAPASPCCWSEGAVPGQGGPGPPGRPSWTPRASPRCSCQTLVPCAAWCAVQPESGPLPCRIPVSTPGPCATSCGLAQSIPLITVASALAIATQPLV